MKKIAVLLLFISVSFLEAEWKLIKQVSLKKDQFQIAVVREDALVRVLKFRWTLFAGDGLTMHLNYNDQAHQFIFYKHYKKDTFEVTLLPRRAISKRVSFLYLVFNKFDNKEKKAYFDIFVDDPEKRALIEVKESK